MIEKKSDTALTFVPFIPPTDPDRGKVADIYCELCAELKDFYGVEYVPLMDDSANDEQSEFLRTLGVEVNPDELSEDEIATLQLAARLHRGLFDLGKHAHKRKDLYAAKKLVTTAIIACEYVKRLESTNPDLMDQVARSTYEWPLLCSLGIELPKPPENLGIQLTEALGVKDTAFKKIENEGRNCRQYALQIVTVLSMNQALAKSIGQNIERFLKGIAKKNDCAVYAPQWFLKCADLPELSKSTVKAWMAVGREMVRDSCPEFYKLDEWKNYKSRAVEELGQGRKIDGVMKREIFNDIKKALMKITLE